ncbi:hypothetical protein HYU50_00885 [Candidatus Woesearchaeota archaeon]|nr:hypothetical protein [Candidatus Woesearchaeota archaeon]
MWILELGSLQRRHIAYKLRIKDILSSRYIKTDGVNPNYLQINSQEVLRLNVIGVVVQKSDMENYSGIVIDDGTGKISARVFENNFLLNNVNVGDVVLVIGRPREYLEEKYLLVEIAKKIDPLWAKARKLELKDFNLQDKDDVKGDEGNKEIFDESQKSRILKIIKELDKGEGVSIDDLPSALGNVDQIVNVLLREGDVFEVRPGRLKVLE